MADPMPQTLMLPYPPSVNHYWRHVGARVLISREGRRYRRQVAKEVMARRLKAYQPADRIGVVLVPAMPDKRARDLDNIEKSVFDSLQHAGLIPDDSQIDVKFTARGSRKPPGGLFVTLWVLGCLSLP